MIKTRPSKFKKPVSILIICEDGKSSVYYFEAKIKECGLFKTATLEKVRKKDVAVDVEPGGKGSAPISVVDYAIQKRDAYNRKAKKEGKYPYGEVYCVMDVDDHNTLGKAVDKIHSVNKDNDESTLYHIISNECFEVWYVLHFKPYSTKGLYRSPSSRTKKYVPEDERIDRVLKHYLNQDYEKSDEKIFGLIITMGGDENKAIFDAAKLETYHNSHSGDKPAYLSNPSTEVYKLIQRLNELKRSRKYKDPMWFEDIEKGDLEKSDYPFKHDDFTNHLMELINKHYADIAKIQKLELLIELFEKPEYNTACIEQPEIAEFFYQEYYKKATQHP